MSWLPRKFGGPLPDGQAEMWIVGGPPRDAMGSLILPRSSARRLQRSQWTPKLGTCSGLVWPRFTNIGHHLTNIGQHRLIGATCLPSLPKSGQPFAQSDRLSLPVLAPMWQRSAWFVEVVKIATNRCQIEFGTCQTWPALAHFGPNLSARSGCFGARRVCRV